MFCPSCGIHQTDGRKFCTSCGTNLMIVSQALSGKAPVLNAPVPSLERGAPSPVPQRSIARQKAELEKGVKLTIVGSAFLAIQFFSFLLSLPFKESGSPFGFFSFVALIVMAVGISKLVSARPLVVTVPVPSNAVSANRADGSAYAQARPHERELPFEPSVSAPPTPTTSSLSLSDPGPSVIEAETEHLPEYVPRTGEKARE